MLYRNTVTRAIDTESRSIEVVASTNSIDRWDSIVRQYWDVEDFRKNPISLFNHDRNMPVGRVEDWKTDDAHERSTARIFFAETDFGEEVFTLYKNRVMNAVSVGFYAGLRTFQEIGEQFIEVLGSPEKPNTLLELSCVTLGGNADAVAMQAWLEQRAPKLEMLIRSMKQDLEADAEDEQRVFAGADVQPASELKSTPEIKIKVVDDAPREQEERKMAEVTREEIDAYIREQIEKANASTQQRFDQTVDGLREEFLGEARAEELADTRDRARAEFDKLSSTERRQKFNACRRAIFDGQLRSNDPVGMTDEVKAWRGQGGGDASLFQRATLLYLRARNEFGPRDAWKEVERIARTSGQADLADTVERVLQASDPDGAGAYIPEPFSMDFIAALYSSSVVRRAGATILDMSEHGNLTIPRQVTSANAEWLGAENDPITPSQGTYGQVKLAYKKLGVFVPVSNDAIRYALGAFDALVTQDMVTVAGIAEDIAFIRGDGSAGVPEGIRSAVDASHVVASKGTDYANITIDALTLQFLVENSDVPILRPAFLMSTRTKYGLLLAKYDETATGAAQAAFREEMMMNETFMGVPYYSTSHIPTNLGDDTDESELYYGEMSTALIGESLRVEVRQSDEASYNDGTQRNSFQRDESVIRLIHEVDFALRYPLGFAVATGVQYGLELETPVTP